MCIYKITSNAYEYLDVYLDFSPLVLLFGGFLYFLNVYLDVGCFYPFTMVW